MRERVRARLAKAENVGSYENPFRVKNGPVRNALGIRGREARARERVVTLEEIEGSLKQHKREFVHTRETH